MKDTLISLIEKYNQLTKLKTLGQDYSYIEYRNVFKEIEGICRPIINKYYIACTEIYKLTPDEMFFGDQYDVSSGTFSEIVKADENYITFRYKDILSYKVVNDKGVPDVKTVYIDEMETMPINWLDEQTFKAYSNELRDKKVNWLNTYLVKLDKAIERTKQEIEHYKNIGVS